MKKRRIVPKKQPYYISFDAFGKIDEEMLVKPYETCGYFNKMLSSKEALLLVNNIGDEKNTKMSGSVPVMNCMSVDCRNENAYYRFHTHPQNTLPYPSYEDFRTVVYPFEQDIKKTYNIKAHINNYYYNSIIFSTAGIYEMVCVNKVLWDMETENEIRKLYNDIFMVPLQDLHFEEKDPLYYNEGQRENEIIRNFRSELYKKFPIFLNSGFNMAFTAWNVIEDGDYKFKWYEKPMNTIQIPTTESKTKDLSEGK